MATKRSCSRANGRAGGRQHCNCRHEATRRNLIDIPGELNCAFATPGQGQLLRISNKLVDSDGVIYATNCDSGKISEAMYCQLYSFSLPSCRFVPHITDRLRWWILILINYPGKHLKPELDLRGNQRPLRFWYGFVVTNVRYACNSALTCAQLRKIDHLARAAPTSICEASIHVSAERDLELLAEARSFRRIPQFWRQF